MRFITEFELKSGDLLAHEEFKGYIIERHKTSSTVKMGEMIADNFGWKNPVLGNPLLHRLEIEAFPIDKWIEFKKNLLMYLQECEEKDELPETLWVLKLIKELES